MKKNNYKFTLCKKVILGIALTISLPVPAYSLTVVSEKILFLNADGRSFVRYDTTRTNHNQYDIWFNKQGNNLPVKPETHLQDYLYLYPNQHRWDRASESNYDIMKISTGSIASLVQGTLDTNSEVIIGQDGVYHYTNWDGKTKTPDMHYGLWNKPDEYEALIYAWVFPKNYNIISYQANRKGNWVKRNNTITYYGNNVNDVVFDIKYQATTNPMYKELSKALLRQNALNKDQLQLEQNAQGVKITLAATVLFSSGSSKLSRRGKAILARLSKTLVKRNKTKVIIKGHSDAVSIKGGLVKKYKTNWELSSTRSLTVLHYMAQHKIPEKRLEARALGSTEPVASNKTKLGRAKNRRIEILIAAL